MLPYTRVLKFEAAAGEENVIALPAPTNGLLDRISIIEVTGSDSFTARFYMDEAAAGTANGDSDVDPDVGLPPDSYAFTPVLSGSSGVYEQYGTRWGYNVNDLAQQGRRKSTIWLRLNPGGSGMKSYAISYTIMMPELT